MAPGALFIRGNAQIASEIVTAYLGDYDGKFKGLKNVAGTRLLDILDLCRSRSCSDEHDKIYSILGLCERSESLTNAVTDMTPNYDQPVADLYLDVASLCIEHQSSFGILLQADRSDLFQQRSQPEQSIEATSKKTEGPQAVLNTRWSGWCWTCYDASGRQTCAVL